MSRLGEVVGPRIWPAIRPLEIRRAVRVLRREVRTSRDLGFWFDFLGSFGDSLLFPNVSRWHLVLAPLQNKSECVGLLEEVQRLRPKRVLEIGTADGGTIFLFARAADSAATLVTVDLPAEGTPHGYPRWKEPVYRALAGPGQTLHLVRADSHRADTVDRVRALVAGGTYDFLFIDADHSYEGVRRDFELYSPLVRPGGIIAFHDVAEDYFHRFGKRTHHDSGDVYRFWRELKGTRAVTEFIEDVDQDGMGIGMLRVPEDARAPRGASL